MSNSKFATGDLALAICDRCRMTYPYNQLRADGNSPGLRVCRNGCYDIRDPYRLPPLQPDAIALRWPRPMVHLVAPLFNTSPEVILATEQSQGGTPIVTDPNQDAIVAQGMIPEQIIPNPFTQRDMIEPIQTFIEYVPPSALDNDL